MSDWYLNVRRLWFVPAQFAVVMAIVVTVAAIVKFGLLRVKHYIRASRFGALPGSGSEKPPVLSGRDFSHLAAAKKSSLILAPSTLVKSAAPFMDIDTIPLGVNFVKVLEGWVEQCEVLLVLMGSFARLASSQSRRRVPPSAAMNARRLISYPRADNLGPGATAYPHGPSRARDAGVACAVRRPPAPALERVVDGCPFIFRTGAA